VFLFFTEMLHVTLSCASKPTATYFQHAMRHFFAGAGQTLFGLHFLLRFTPYALPVTGSLSRGKAEDAFSGSHPTPCKGWLRGTDDSLRTGKPNPRFYAGDSATPAPKSARRNTSSNVQVEPIVDG